MSIDVTHDRAAHRFETIVDGHPCELDYTLASGILTITHTGVPPEVGGRGIASALVQAAFDFARGQRLRVVPACSYAVTWAARHPEVADLLSA